VFLSALINGLQASLVEQTLGSQAHVVVRAPEEMPRVLGSPAGDTEGVRGVEVQRPPQRVRSIEQWQRVVEEIDAIPEVVAVAPTVAGPAMAVRGQGSSSVAVRGIEPSGYGRIVDIRSRIVAGSEALQSADALIGVDLAEDLGLSVGERLRLQAREGRS